MSVAKAQAVPFTVNSTETAVVTWDVKDVRTLSISIKNTGSEAVTPYLKRRVFPGDDWGPSPLSFDTPAQDGVIQPGETGAKDVDCASNGEVGLFATSALVSSTILYSVRPDDGTR